MSGNPRGRVRFQMSIAQYRKGPTVFMGRTSGDRKARSAGKIDGPNQQHCAHCERTCNNFAGGSSKVGNKLLCHPNVGNRPDCYALVDRYKHPTPCDSKVCYEDHDNIMTYVRGRNYNDKVPSWNSKCLDQ